MGGRSELKKRACVCGFRGYYKAGRWSWWVIVVEFIESGKRLKTDLAENTVLLRC